MVGRYVIVVWFTAVVSSCCTINTTRHIQQTEIVNRMLSTEPCALIDTLSTLVDGRYGGAVNDVQFFDGDTRCSSEGCIGPKAYRKTIEIIIDSLCSMNQGPVYNEPEYAEAIPALLTRQDLCSGRARHYVMAYDWLMMNRKRLFNCGD